MSRTPIILLTLAIIALSLPVISASQDDPEEVTEKLYFDVTIGGQDAGRIVFGMFGNTVPRTVANFATICKEGIKGMSYNGTKFHRVIQSFMIQGKKNFTSKDKARISIAIQFGQSQKLLNTINFFSSTE
jgi:hypothetical protein